MFLTSSSELKSEIQTIFEEVKIADQIFTISDLEQVANQRT